MKAYPTYSEAKTAGDTLVEQLAKGSQVPAMTPGQAADALAAFDRLHRFYQTTGRKLTLREGIAQLCEALVKLDGHTLDQAVDGFLTTVVTVQRKALGDAVKDFIDGRKHLTIEQPSANHQATTTKNYKNERSKEREEYQPGKKKSLIFPSDIKPLIARNEERIKAIKNNPTSWEEQFYTSPEDGQQYRMKDKLTSKASQEISSVNAENKKLLDRLGECVGVNGHTDEQE